MSDACSFDALMHLFRERFAPLPDHRTGKNRTYTITDALLGAFAVFFTQAPSFLAAQQSMQRARGQSNAHTLFGMTAIPCDNQIRNLLDPIPPSQLFPLFATIADQLERSGVLTSFRSFAGSLLIAFDGTQYFSSHAISCANCSTKTTSVGTTTYSHPVITPVLVAPGQPEVVPLEPEFIFPQDGADKQDCELAAAKRWLHAHDAHYSAKNVTILGDDLYCQQPFCELLLAEHVHFILVCKPDSHPALYAMRDFLAATGGVAEVVVRHWNGRFVERQTYRYANDLPLRAEEPVLLVNWCELCVTHETTGALLYHNAFATDHRLDDTTVVAIVRDGRTRWKVENENNNVLKTKGYHLEHNYGHGKQYLSAVLVTLNLLAFVVHTVLSLVQTKYQVLRATLGPRQTLFQDIRTLTRYLLFASWEQLLDFMLTQLEVELPPDTS